MIADILSAAQNWQGSRMALATVVNCAGSAPFPIGTHMLMRAGDFVGGVSAGCVENDVLFHCEEVIGGAPFSLKIYQTRSSGQYVPGLPCGGDIEILVQPVTADGFSGALFDYIRAARADRRTASIATDLASGKSMIADHAQSNVFVNSYAPPVHLILIGAVAIAQSLSRMAAAMGCVVTIIDPRGFYARDSRFPGLALDMRTPDMGLPALNPDARTAIIALSHDSAIDDPALVAAVQSKAGYIAALGSRRNHAARCDRLKALGVTAENITRIEGPAGVDLGAKGPEGIAASILAGVVKAIGA
jgi:xanthine dehydrogenase accessory factor